MNVPSIETVFAKTRIDHDAFFRKALIDLDEIDTSLGDRYLDTVRDVLNGIAQERLGRGGR